MPETKLIVGLGNPGIRYQKTRHNFGFAVVESCLKKENICLAACRYAKALTACVRNKDDKVIFALPQTYMNLSGGAVLAIMNFEQIGIKNILVIADDLHLDFGHIRLRLKGSDAGHNGLKSITDCLQTTDYARLKLGIGRPSHSQDQSQYVLSQFLKEEVQKIEKVIENAENCLSLWLQGSFQEAMSKYNGS